MPVSTSPPALLSVGGDSAGLSPAGAALAWPGRGLPLAAQPRLSSVGPRLSRVFVCDDQAVPGADTPVQLSGGLVSASMLTGPANGRDDAAVPGVPTRL